MANGLDVLLGDGGSAPATGLDVLLGGALPPMQASNPTDDMSTLDKLRAGIGMGMANVTRAVGQAAGLVDQKDIDEAKRLDASLNATTPGKIGDVIGQSATVAPAMLIPGANTYVGAALTGAGVGALTTPGDVKTRALGAAFGGVGGIAGKGLGDAAGAGVNWLANRRAAAEVANAGRDAAATAAKDAGYVIPPADTNPTMFNEVLNGVSGKIKTAQVASARNQLVTNDLARSAVGAPLDEPLTVDALNTIRQNASNAYGAVANSGTVVPGRAYDDALDAIVAPYVKAAQGFPNAKPNPIIGEIDALRSPSFDAGSAIAKISSLRADADAAYRSGNSDMGRALKAGAGALEDALDTHLQLSNAPADMLQNFRDARQLIAKTYSVQKGLNNTTGDVAAPALAKQLAKGKPLSGDLLTIAQAASSFPKATQALQEAPKQLSPLDFMGGLVAASASGHPAAALLPIIRPAVRSTLLSGAYQRTLGAPSYSAGTVQGLLEDALRSQMLQRVAPVESSLLAARAAQ